EPNPCRAIRPTILRANGRLVKGDFPAGDCLVRMRGRMMDDSTVLLQSGRGRGGSGVSTLSRRGFLRMAGAGVAGAATVPLFRSTGWAAAEATSVTPSITGAHLGVFAEPSAAAAG